MAATITTSVVTGGSNSHATSASEVNAVATDFVTSGVNGSITLNTGSGGTGSFAVNAQGSPAMFVDVTAGSAYITATPSGQASQKLRPNMSANYTSYAISANASGSTKYDWIYLSVDPTKANNPASDASDVTSLYTSRSSSNGTDNGSPPTYGLLLAVVTVANGASSITNSNISDKRTQSSVGGGASTTGWTTATLPSVSSTTANGNRSYSITFASSVAATLSPGMRLRTTRTVAAPTQCTSLNGTTQYYSKSSPAGMTFTDDFTVTAWVKMTAYGTNVIASRYNGTSGWSFYINSSGQVQLSGFNAGAANVSSVTSYQSIPLNKWVFIQANLDMSAFTTNTDGGAAGSTIALDGVNVPATVGRGGTNPTALIQAGNLEIGSQNGGTNFFPGKLAQVAIYNTKITIATINGYMSQTLAGTETSQISAYSFNNSINDLNANANNLSANGSAVATNADSPFGGQADGTISSTLDYAIVTKVATTVATVQVPEGCTVPTTGGVSSVDFSAWKVPYLFPAQRGKWQVLTLDKTAGTQSSPSAGTWYNPNSDQVSVPIGEWELMYEANTTVTNNTNNGAVYATLSTANNSESDRDFTSRAITTAASANSYDVPAIKIKQVSLSSATPYYLLAQSVNASATAVGFNNSAATSTQIVATCAHL